jgi:hypothetical protein
MRLPVLAKFLLALLLAAPAAAQTPQRDALHAFLQTAHADARENYADTTYTAAFADLNGDGREEAVVSLQSGLFCGSGGCALYIYTPDGASWRQLADLTIVNAPVRLLNTRTRGWRDLGVHVRGGGFEIPREARMRFDGTTYASNPSMAPRTRRGAQGRVLIADDTPSRRLF